MPHSTCSHGLQDFSPLPPSIRFVILGLLKNALTVAWISDFPVEWLPEIPEPLRKLPRRHPATWQIVLLSEFERNPRLRLHIILLRQRIAASLSFERRDVVFHVLKAPAFMRLGSLFWADTFLIRRVCRGIAPDLVHAWGIEKGAAMIAPRFKYPYLLTVQGLFAWYKEMGPLPAYYRLIARLEPTALSRAPLLTTESTFAVQFLKQRFPGIEVHQAEHAPNRCFFEVRRQPQIAPIHFIAVGELCHRKGTDLLFEALNRLVSELPFKLTVISGPDTSYLKSLRPGLWAKIRERVEFKHHLLPPEVAKAFETPALMLLPTRADVSPNAVKEAVVAGIPVVASDIGGIPDYVRPGENGLLFPAGDLEKFMRAIQEAVRHPLFGRGLVESNSLARSRDYLSPARMGQNFLSAYGRVLEKVTALR